MLRLFCILTFWLCLGRETLPAQPADLGQSGKATQETRYIRLWLANDVLQSTDRYYTGGIRIEYAAPGCGKMPLRRLLVSLGKEAVGLYGVTLAADAFTPTRLGTAEVPEDDRPYAGYLYAGQFLVSRLPGRNLTLTTRMNVGIMGPAAGMRRVQKRLHFWLDCEQPRGWHNQVATNLLLDYALLAEQTLWNPVRFLELTAQAGVRVGTLYNHLTGGATFRLGKLYGHSGEQPPAGLLLPEGRYYVYAQARGNWVGYNATLQGGPMETRSRYTLRGDQISRVVSGQTVGAVFSLGNLSIEGGQTWVTAEFAGGAPHRWNHVSLGLFF